MNTLKTTMCRYHYDALDQLVAIERSGQERVQRFYRRDHLVTELQRTSSKSVFQHDSQLLVLQSRQGNGIHNRILSTDRQRSVLHVTDAAGSIPQVYAPYGNRWVDSDSGSLLGFTGEAVDPFTGHYLLGKGHRAFNSVLRRFNSPDRLSPFARGGLNPYAYCLGDPVNFSDPTGQAAAKDWQPWLFVALSVLSLVSSGVGLFSARLSIKSSKINGKPASASFSKIARYAGMTGAAAGLAGAVAGVARSTVSATDPDNSALDPLLIAMAVFSALSFAATATSVSYSFRAYKINRAEAVIFAHSGRKPEPYRNPQNNERSDPLSDFRRRTF
ncbi:MULTISPECIES: RHS repeat-associated core domain-containing protein [unclassified Pseudomonas]|uniref:RHS repeat-associated core domain-containing protein n=6 Tax=Pseudomonas TaxID=286 RepID=UPI001CBBF6AF|nr:MULTISPECIES: RHS repeat-associated core domain-containing protein [unclassified Pseudomonas]